MSKAHVLSKIRQNTHCDWEWYICLRCWRDLREDRIEGSVCTAGVTADVPVTPRSFEDCLDAAWHRLPRPVRRELQVRGINITTQDAPPDDAAWELRNAMALYVPQMKMIQVYRKTCEHHLDMPLEERLFRVLWHEVAHVLGLTHGAMHRDYEL